MMDEDLEMIERVLETVSGSDADVLSSVSGSDAVNVYYQVEVYTVSGGDAEPHYTLFDKPLTEYTVSEGLLLLLVVLLVSKFVWSAIKEGFKWLSW